MNVELLNPEECKKFFTDWGNASKVYYGADIKNVDLIGKSCMDSGHNSGSRGTYFKFEITGVPRFTVDQAVRAQVGTFMNVQSFRYVDKDNFKYAIPEDICDDKDLVKEYKEHMASTLKLYKKIEEHITSTNDKKERAHEQARYVLPMATETAFVMGFTYEALVHFMNIRLCARAEDKIRELAQLMKQAVLEVLPELESKLVPQCQALLYCPETKSCGAYMLKANLLEIINESKKYYYFYDCADGQIRAYHHKLSETLTYRSNGDYDAYIGMARNKSEAKKLLIEGGYYIDAITKVIDELYGVEQDDQSIEI